MLSQVPNCSLLFNSVNTRCLGAQSPDISTPPPGWFILLDGEAEEANRSSGASSPPTILGVVGIANG